MRNQMLMLAALALAACKKEAPTVVYQAVPVEKRNIIVSAQAAGVIQPDTTVEVKSKASGEILDMMVETGQLVQRGALMVQVDQRTPRNTLAQAEAQLEVAQARLQNAQSQLTRANELFKSQSITQTEQEKAVLDFANAKAEVVGAGVAVENAKIRMADTDVRAPITGTIIEKNVERGQVISSPTSDVGGGTILLKMADLNLVQVRTLVDETDIGKIRPGLRATVTVDAYPNTPFDGEVLKVEPLATTQQNVTMFPVIVRIANRDGRLRPGMNAEVEIHVGQRDSVLAIPNASLRTQRDVASAAQVLGLDPASVTAQLAASDSAAAQRADSGAGRTSQAAVAPKDSGATKAAPAGNTMTTPDGRVIPLPPGVTEAQVRAIFAKRMSGKELSDAERALLRQVFAGMGGGRPGGAPRAPSNDFQFGGRYIVFVLRNGVPTPVNVRTGLTDLDYSEVASGLAIGDSVLVLPSASLIQSQQEFKQRIGNITGGGLPGVRQTTTPPATGGGR
ncbi:MAG TPA: efflux RND transporter periplasmic adaptor subunit [Gemmatimonadales bacterium]|nr:efflux RND transporter periplasmic adaptor subunit [Gemmatimonadales bacterium]